MEQLHKLTPEQKQQLMSTVGDKYWRLTNLYSINSKDKGKIKFLLNNVQTLIKSDLNTFDNQTIRYFTLKARQMGVSTFWETYFLDEVLFHRDYTCGVLAHKWESLKYLMSMIKFIYSNMDERYKPKADLSETRIYVPSINSRMFISLEIVSTTLNALHISEICKCKDESVKVTLAGTLANKACHIVAESTAEGMRGIGYAMYQGANEDKKLSRNGFKRKFFPWFIHEEYTISLEGLDAEKLLKEFKNRQHTIKMIEYAKRVWNIVLTNEQLYWYKQTAEIEKELMQQEHPYCDTEAFIASGGTFFAVEKIQALYNEAIEYEETTGYDEVGKDYIMFKRPVRRHVYALGCDPANGGSNYFVFKIFDCTTREEVFIFRARCGLDYGYRMVDEWGRKYNDALAGIEEQNHGHAVLLGLNEICRYPNIYKRKVQTRLKSNQKVTQKLGWETNKHSRDLMLDEIRFALEGKYEEDVEHFQPLLRFYDKTLLEECFTFIDNKGKIEADDGVDKDSIHGQGYDDDIIATSITLQMYKIQRRYVNPLSDEPRELQIYING